MTWRAGKYLQEHAFLSVSIIAILFALTTFAFVMYYKKKRRGFYHLGFVSLSAAGFASLLTLFPQVLENLLRYYGWVSGLATTAHHAFGKIVEPLPGGYGMLFLTENLSITVLLYPIGVFLALCAAAFAYMRRGEMREYTGSKFQKSVLIVTLALLPIAWMFFLSTSPKQAWRYAMPSLFAVGIVSAYAAASILSWILAQKKNVVTRMLPKAVLVVFAGFLFFTYIRTYPNFNFFFNSISGGIHGALQREQGFWFPGQRSVMRAITKDIKIQKRGGLQYVAVFGDPRSLKATIQLHYQNFLRRLVFGYYPPNSAHYLVIFASHRYLVTPEYREFMRHTKPMFAYHIDGAEVAWVYRVS